MKNNIKIAVVVSHPIQHFCPQYANWAKVQGIELKVFFGSTLGSVKYVDPQFNKEISFGNLYLDEFNHEFLNGNQLLQSTPKLDAPNLNERLNEFKPNLVIHYGYGHKLVKRARTWAIKNNIKLAFISDSEHRRKRPFWKEMLKIPYLYFLFKKEDYFLTVGNANEAYYKYYGVANKKLLRMHFPIDIKNYEIAYQNKATLNNSYRQKLGINENEIVIAVVGKVLTFKSQNHLIDVVKNLEKSLPNKKIHLLIVGSGAQELEFKEIAKTVTKNKVHFLGFVMPIELPEIYAATNIYIQPSLMDAHSLSVSEAIYLGCSAIVANTTGSWGETDDVQMGKNGFVYQYGNINELESQIINIIEEEKLLQFEKYSLEISKKFQQQSHFGIMENLKNKF